jgi:hypothetical protein
MREDNRISYAIESAKAVVRQLKDNDMLGVIGFDVSAFTVVPFDTVGRVRRVFEAQIDRLKPGGQTYFYPALLEAKRQIERANTGRRHIILLSDGETRGSQGELIDLVTVMKNEMKVTVSAVAIGAEADIRIMKRIAQYGGGLFHYALDPSTLPQIVLQQLQDNPRDEPQGDKTFIPVQNRGSQVLATLGNPSYPPVLGYMETELKPGAQLDLLIPREDRKAPLLASWQYGRGRAVAGARSEVTGGGAGLGRHTGAARSDKPGMTTKATSLPHPCSAKTRPARRTCSRPTRAGSAAPGGRRDRAPPRAPS